ncbi:MAG: MFS transporter [Pirellulaceae bacterium]
MSEAVIETRPHQVRLVVAGVIGNVLEWYDFALFGYFASVISGLFFPGENQLAALLQTFGVFAVGYAMRPLGGVIFGHIGDRYSRKRALELSVILMAIPTTCLGLLPTYAAIGIAAPILLTLIRIVQGVSVGGEMIGSVSFLGEHSPAGRRGLLGSWSMCSAIGGILLGSAVAALMHEVLPDDALQTWGWRIPFVCGSLVGVVGLWLRRGIEEPPPEPRPTGAFADRSPVVQALAENRLAIFQTFAITTMVSVGFYMPFVWLSTWLMKINKPPLESALTVNTLAMTVLLLLIPLGGIISDRIGRKLSLLLSAAAYVVLAYPLFLLLSRGDFASALVAQLVFALCAGLALGGAPAAYVELFPRGTRYSGIAIGYNAAQAVFGGTTPLVCTWLISASGDLDAPGIYLAAIGLCVGLVVLTMKDRSKEPLT